MRKIYFALVVLWLPWLTWSQPFSNINAPLAGLGYSSAAWGDYDSDGDLDIALTGEPASTIPAMKIYRNDNGSFTDINANLPGITVSSLEWGDYDNDGDLDILVTGNNDLGNPTTRIIRNDNGNFSAVNTSLSPVSDGQATWGDYDNDGDLDILLAGSMKAGILRNDGNDTFTDIIAHFPNVQFAFCTWGDYNNDGWLDALVGGDTGGTMITRLYRNEQGIFTEDTVGFMALCGGQARWGDLDNDGNTDLVLGGVDGNSNGHFVIYKNDGNGQFTLIENYTFGILYPFIDLGDYDNDGLLDIMLAGKIQGCGTPAMTMLYDNQGSMVFFDVSTLIPGFRNGSVAWGDYNNDGHPDLLFAGFNNYDEPVTAVYRNNAGTGTFTQNTPPALPSGLSSEVDGNSVTLRWNKSTDNQTPQDGLYYNIRIGTSAVTADIYPPLADLSTGFRRVSAPGNASMDTSWTVHDLEPGTYYWSVQALDNAFAGSGFAPEQTFSIYAAGIPENDTGGFTVCPNPFTDKIFFRDPHPDINKIEIYSPDGRFVLGSEKETCSLDLSGLVRGIYILKAITKSGIYSKIITKN